MDNSHAPRMRRRFVTKLHTNLQAAEPVWRSLEREGDCTAFQRFDWARMIDAHLLDPRTDEWQIVEVRSVDGGEALLILPFIRARKRGFRETSLACFGVCDYSAPITARGLDLDETEISELWLAVRATLGPTDVLRVSGLVASNGKRANPLARLAGVAPTRHAAMTLRLAGDAETVLERCCKPSFVRDFAKFSRKLARKDAVSFVEVQRSGDVATVFDTLLTQRRARFEKLGRFDLLARPEIAAFYRAAAIRGLLDGSTRLFALMSGPTTVATFYALVHRDTFHGVMISIDDVTWKSYSPGALIYGHTIIWAASKGLAHYDLAIGVPEYKKSMGLEDVQVLEMTEVITMRGLIATSCSRAAERLDAALRRHPALFNRLRRARRAIRRATTRARPNVTAGEAT